MRRRSFLASSAALLGTTALQRTSTAHEPFTTLGFGDVPGTHDAVVEGTTVYVAANDGFATVDVSDPTEPTVLADERNLLSDVEDGPLGQIFDVAVEDDRLVVAGPANPQLGALQGFGVYDVSDPAAPERTGVHTTEFPIHNLDIADGIAYLTGNNGADNPLVAVDVTGTPAEVGRWSLVDHDGAWRDVPGQFRTLHDIWAQDGRAYLAHWDAGTWVVDVSDPAAITMVSKVRGRTPAELTDGGVDSREFIRLPGNDHYVSTDEDATLLGVGAEAWSIPGGDEDGGPGGIELYDISTPTDPERLARIDPPPTEDTTFSGEWTTSHNFDIVGDRLYSSWYRGGVRVHDLSDPSDPEQLAAWQARDTAEFFTAKKVDDEPVFVGSSTRGGSGGQTMNSGIYTFPGVDDQGSPLVEAHSLNDGAVETTTTTAETTTTDSSEATTRTTAVPTTETSLAETTAADAPTSGATPTDPTTGEPATTEDGNGPGFGVPAALAGLLGGWYAHRRRRE